MLACQGRFNLSLLVAAISLKNDIKLKHFPRYWPFVWGIHRSPVNSPHKGQWRGSLMFSLICVWINGWVNNREAGDLKLYRAHYDVIVMIEASYGRWPTTGSTRPSNEGDPFNGLILCDVAAIAGSKQRHVCLFLDVAGGPQEITD